MPRANWSVLKKYELAIPDDFLGQQFSEAIDAMAWTAAELSGVSRVLSRVNDLLLPKVLSGAIDITTLQLDDVFGWSAVGAGAN